MYYFISQNKDQNHFKIISKALNSRCLKNYKSPLIGSGGFWTTIRMKSSSGATYTRETRLIIGKLSEEHQSAKSQNIWQPWFLMLYQKLNMFSTFFFKVIPLRAKRVGEFIKIRPKKFHLPVHWVPLGVSVTLWPINLQLSHQPAMGLGQNMTPI